MATRKRRTRPTIKNVAPTRKTAPNINKSIVQQRGPTYDVVVTAIPNGIQDSWLRLSLVFSPRLKGSKNTNLSAFGARFTKDWPDFIRGLPFQMVVNAPGGPLRLPTKGEWEFAAPPKNVPPFSPSLWRSIFNDSTFVRVHAFDKKEFTNINKFKVHTFPEKAMYRQITDALYKATAREQFDQLPTRGTILQRLEQSSILKQDGRAPAGFRMGLPNAVRELGRIRGLFKGGSSPPGVRSRGINKALLGRHIAAPKVTDQQLSAAAKITRPEFNYLQYKAFDQKIRITKDIRVPPRPPEPKYDFHQIVGSLFEYPVLTRQLGLCVDLRVKIDKGKIPKNGLLWVEPVFKNSAEKNRFISPRTAYVLGGPTGFMSDPQGPSGSQSGRIPENRLQLSDGLLKFGVRMTVEGRRNVPVYDVVPGNVDEVVKRVEVYSSNLLHKIDTSFKTLSRIKPQVFKAPQISRPNIVVPRSTRPQVELAKTQRIMQIATSLPSVRSSGLGVAHNTRDGYLDELLDQSSRNNGKLQASTNNRGSNIILTGEDLVRGFRIDVREVRRGSGGSPVFTPWRSLNFRQGNYHLLQAPNSPLSKPFLVQNDEGWVSLGMTEDDGDPAEGSNAPKRLIVYESLFRWDGWSLSVPRPGRHLDLEDNPSQSLGDRLAKVSKMQVVFQPVPGTLPRLRFGRKYQFRARVVDLAGNGLSVTDMPSPNAVFLTDIKDEDSHYQRMEPVPSPTVLLTAPIIGKKVSSFFPNGEALSPGEAVDRIVYRSLNVEKPGDPREGLPAGPPSRPSARHLVPPKISVELAEQHGMFDDPGNRRVRGAQAYQLMVAKDGTLADMVPKERLAPNGKPGGEYFPEPSITVPYLPDPMAQGVSCVLYAPGANPKTAPVVQVPYPVKGGWPNVGSFRVQLEPGNGAPKISGPNLLQVFVPPGEERILRISSYLLHAQDPKFGKIAQERLFTIWRWLEEKTSSKKLQGQRRNVQMGKHQMLTPFHQIVLTHATQQPVLNPRWVCIEELPEKSLGLASAPACTVQSPRAEAARHRRYGETASTIDGTLAIHRPSTEEIDLQAEWQEPIDHPNKPMTSENLKEWLYVQGSAAPFNVKISYLPSRTPGPVVARGLSEADEEVPEDLDDDTLIAEFEELDAVVDAQEMPVLSEVQSRAVPESPTEEGEEDTLEEDMEEEDLLDEEDLPEGAVMERGVSKRRRRRRVKAVKRVKPIKPAGPKAYDERPHRCAPAPPPPPPAKYGQRFRFQGLHRFGDTKYRCVAYTAIGTTRYREYFRPIPDEETDLLKNGKLPPRWTRSSAPIMLDILNSAQPEAPKVLYVVPTFKWEKTPKGHRRTGGGLRVYLDRPWYSSGDGEQLAVVLFPNSRATLPEKAKGLVTQWGKDPLWETGPQRVPPIRVPKKPTTRTKPALRIPKTIRPRGIEEEGEPILEEEEEEEVTSRAARRTGLPTSKVKAAMLHGVGISNPTPQHFRNAAAVRHDLSIQVPDSSGGGVRSRAVKPSKRILAKQLRVLRPPPMPVTICAFDVKPDVDRQLWYCDIDMNPGTAYFPFVRLALARYQVNSIKGAHLSPVVLADFAQLVPDRTASVVADTKKGNQVVVTVSGVPGVAGSKRQTKVEVEVEEANPSVKGDLAWTPVSNTRPVTLKKVQAQQWTGSVPLPPSSGKQFRVVVKEYEVFNIPKEADSSSRPRKDVRLVYADALPVKR